MEEEELKELGTSTESSNDDITEVEVFPLSSYSKIQLSSQTVDSLVQSNPDALFRIVEENQRQQGVAQQHEYELEKIKLEYKQALSVKAEEAKQISEKSDKNLIRFGIVAFIVLFGGVLLYSVRVNDKNLPSTIFTAAMSAIAGGGVVLAKEKKDKDKKDQP